MKRFSPEPSPLLEWKNRNLTQRPHGYPRPSPVAKPVAAPVRPPPPPEFIVGLNQLSTSEQLLVQALRHMGADEIKDTLSLQRLKKAHRRLAKQLHPDRLDPSMNPRERERREEQFLLLQEAYEGLSEVFVRLESSPAKSAA